MSRRLAILAAGLGAALAGAPAAGSEFYPLDPGRSWEYRARVTTATGEVRDSEFARRTMPARTLDGVRAIPFEYSHGAEVTGWVYVVEDATGVQWLARQNAGETEPTPYGAYVLRKPLEPGTSWSDHARPFLLGLDGEIALTARIRRADGPVEVAAGSFDDCLVVETSGTEEIAAGALRGSSVTIEAVDWHCRGVGFVRSSTTHRLRNRGIDVRGTRVEELTGFDR